MANERKTGAYSIFKKSAAAKYALVPPTYKDTGWMEKEGSVMIDAAVSTGEDGKGNYEYDWKNKIVFSLSINDLALLFDDFSKSLVHQYQGKTKTLQFIPGKEKYEGTYMMQLLEKDDSSGQTRKVSVPVSSGEAAVIGRLLGAATTKILGW
jgi:hypothetical protein